MRLPEHSNKRDVLGEEGMALLEMYKAGFLDAYKIDHKLKTKADWILMNKRYKVAFCRRFEKRIRRLLKEK